MTSAPSRPHITICMTFSLYTLRSNETLQTLQQTITTTATPAPPVFASNNYSYSCPSNLCQQQLQLLLPSSLCQLQLQLLLPLQSLPATTTRYASQHHSAEKCLLTSAMMMMIMYVYIKIHDFLQSNIA